MSDLSQEKTVAAQFTKFSGKSLRDLGLRFDRVVVRVQDDVRDFASSEFPDAVLALITMTAPIRLPGNTAEALKEKLSELLVKKPIGKAFKANLCGNKVCIEIVKVKKATKIRSLVFVHNTDSSLKDLLNFIKSTNS